MKISTLIATSKIILVFTLGQSSFAQTIPTSPTPPDKEGRDNGKIRLANTIQTQLDYEKILIERAKKVFLDQKNKTDTEIITYLQDLTRRDALTFWSSGDLHNIYQKVYQVEEKEAGTGTLKTVYRYAEYTPIFLDVSAFSSTQTYSDWNRLSFGAFFSPSSNGARGTININAAFRRLSYPIYEPKRDKDGALTDKFDLTRAPQILVLTREQYVKYYSQIKASFGGRGKDLSDPGRGYFQVGISPADFKLGATSSTPIDPNAVGSTAEDNTKATTAYMVSYSYSLNPYVYLNLGIMTSNGRSYKPGFGFSFDSGIISAIFK